jgi:hypothetical protein
MKSVWREFLGGGGGGGVPPRPVLIPPNCQTKKTKKQPPKKKNFPGTQDQPWVDGDENAIDGSCQDQPLMGNRGSQLITDEYSLACPRTQGQEALKQEGAARCRKM